jgi:hypothetical protein
MGAEATGRFAPPLGAEALVREVGRLSLTVAESEATSPRAVAGDRRALRLF